MAKLIIPSLQHLARNWRDTPDLVKKSLVGLARNPPQITYAPLNGAISDLLVLRVPYEQVERASRAAFGILVRGLASSKSCRCCAITSTV